MSLCLPSSKCSSLTTHPRAQFMSLSSLYVRSGDGFLLVFSLTSLDSVAELHTIWEQIQRIKETTHGTGAGMGAAGRGGAGARAGAMGEKVRAACSLSLSFARTSAFVETRTDAPLDPSCSRSNPESRSSSSATSSTCSTSDKSGARWPSTCRARGAACVSLPLYSGS